MAQKSFLEIIEENRGELINAGLKAYKEARENPHLLFKVEIDSDGEINSWYQPSGGNNYHVSNIPGLEIMEVFNFCFQCSDYSSDEEEPIFIQNMKEYGRNEELQAIYEEAEENNDTFMSVVISGKYIDELKEADAEILEYEMMYDAPEYIESALDSLIVELERRLA